MKVDIGEYGRYDTSLRCTGLRRVPTLTLKISSFQELCNQFQKSIVLNATLQTQDELLVTYVVEASLDITLNDQSLHTISKNVGLFLTDKTPLNELFNKAVPTEETEDWLFPSLFRPDDF